MATETWITITTNDLRPFLVAAGVTAYQTSALGSGQGDPFDDIMPAVIARMRAFIKACKTNILSATENSIPLSLKGVACLMIIEGMEGRLPNVNLTERQQKALERGYEELKMVASCELPVTIPDDPADENTQEGPNATLISSTCLTTRPCQTKGMM